MLINSRCVAAYREKSCLIRFDNGFASVLTNSEASLVTL